MKTVSRLRVPTCRIVVRHAADGNSPLVPQSDAYSARRRLCSCRSVYHYCSSLVTKWNVCKLIGEECHKCVYGPVSRCMTALSDFSEEKRNLLIMRTSSGIVNICNYHEVKFSRKYHHLFGNSCCDPLKIHKKSYN